MSDPFDQFPRTLSDRLAELEGSRARLLGEIDLAQARPQVSAPATGRWSVAEVAYHLHLAEKSIVRMLTKALASSERAEPASEARLREEWERVRALVGTRAARVQAPPRVVPEGAPELEKTILLLAESRRDLLGALRQAEDLQSVYLPHPFPQVGTLAGTSWLSVVAFHELRHAGQIREIAATPAEP